jgi:hypothetical protein
MAREAFVHDAELVLNDGVDPGAAGAAVTTELCGHWEHEGPCRWPHNSDIDVDSEPARFRTVFVAEPAEEQELRVRIEGALAAADGWRVVSSGPRALTPNEQALGERLARTPIPSQ